MCIAYRIHLSFAALTSAVLIAQVATAQTNLLNIDFELSGASETGFQRLSSGNISSATASQTYGTTAGNITVSTSATGSSAGYFDRGPALADNPPAFNLGQLYSDFVYDNSAGTLQFVLSGPGIQPNTAYGLTFYAFDLEPSVVTTTQFLATPGSNTTGTTGIVSYNGAVPPVTDAQYRTSIIVSSTDNSLEIDADIISGSFNRVNGFQLFLIPEPASVTLLALGAAVLLRARRSSRTVR